MTRHKKVIASLLAVIILGTVITIGASQIHPTSFNKAKNSVVNIVQNFSWSWTGFSGKTLWDVLELSSKLLVPILIFSFGLLFQKKDKKKTEEQNKREKQIAKDNLAEEVIQTYLNHMSNILLNEEYNKKLFPNIKSKFKTLNKDNPVRDITRAQTITTLKRLEEDKERQTRIIDFLHDTELYQFIFQNANLSKINLSQAKLTKANFQRTNLSWANLQRTNLSWANLQDACLS